jgi:hypothetical protein
MRYTTILAICIAATLLIGCTGNDPTKENADAQSDSMQDTTNKETTVQTTSTQTESSTWDIELTKMFKARTNLQWKIDYDIKGTAEGVSTNMKVSEYMKGTKIRTDLSVMGIDSRTYILGDEYTSCTYMNKQWNCNKIKPAETETKSAKDIEMDYTEDPDKFKTEYAGTKTVAGENTQCFKVTDLEDDIVTTYCYTKEALPLYIKSVGPDSESEMTATSFSRTVSDSDFELPQGAKMTEGEQPGIGSDPCATCSYLPEDMQADCLASCA